MSEKKTILITGASSGLGKATAVLFASRGWNVLAAMRSPEDADEALTGADRITTLTCDVDRPEQVEAMAVEALRRGAVDVVFANAGYALSGPLEAITDDQLCQQIDTNLLGPIRTVKAFIKHFRERGSGTFLVTVSPSGYVGMPLLSLYSASKFGVLGWAEALSYELPAGLAIKAIVPGSMRTRFLGSISAATQPEYQELAEKTSAMYADASRNAKDGTPELVAETVWVAATDGSQQFAYLATDEARQTVAARESMGAEGFRAHLRQMLSL